VIRYKGAKRAVPDIARELGVEALVEGAVLRSGDRVRITAQLIDAQTDRHLWAESYERDLRDVLALQAEVARSIALQVRVKLSPLPGPLRTGALNPEAYELYLKGRYSHDKGNEEGLKLAFAYFQQALELDPQYAAAYAGLADSYAMLPFYTDTPPREAFPKAKAAATKACSSMTLWPKHMHRWPMSKHISTGIGRPPNKNSSARLSSIQSFSRTPRL